MAVESSSRRTPERAFNEIRPSGSPSAPSKQQHFDVFINHRGPDVKLKLASTIYHALDLLRVKAFLDQKELDLGDLIPQAIENAMRSVLIHIAIFSKDYATSPWCLEELSFMQKNTQAPIIPIFYDVEPGDLKWGTRGLYADAFSKHAEKDRFSPETIEKWKKALDQVATLDGYVFKSDRDDEGILLKTVVNRVTREVIKVNLPFEEARYPVGLDEAVGDFETFLKSAKVHQGVKIVGIVGMCGCGKTTLARKFCNIRYSMFDSYSFLSEVKKAAALSELQKKLLVDVVHLGHDITAFRDASELKGMLARPFKSLTAPVLIILDDVDHVDQLNNLLPVKGKNLGSGSLIIITTRDDRVLKPWDISIYRMKALDLCHSEELFCWHAFLKASPPEPFKDLVQRFICACNGLPLFIEVIAGMLYGKPEDEWRFKLKKISILNTEEIQKLRPIYDALNPAEKYIFLDVACFFVGEKINLAIAVWEADDRNGRETLENLRNKCLVEVDKKNRIRMNDILRDLGKQVAIESWPPRLWSPKHITRIIECTEQRTLIRGIMAATTQFSASSGRYKFPECCDSYPPPFQKCMALGPQILFKLLVVHGKYFTPDFANLSADLVWLRCFDFQHEKLPSWLSLTNLRVLELYGASKLQELWENNAHVQPPVELKEMIVTATEHSSFHIFPSIIADLTHLTKIALISYRGEEFRFIELPDAFCNLQSLEHLELRNCKMLSKLPLHFGRLTKLRHLDLCSCQMLSKLPDTFKQLVNLEYLDLSGCKRLALMPDILVNITKLEILQFSGCRKLGELPEQIAEQKSLRELHLKKTMLIDVPTNIDQLSKLETLVVGSPPLTAFPISLGNLSSLTRLKITRCTKLESLPESLGRLKFLEHLCIKYSGLRSLPQGFRQLINLQYLKIIDCPIAELDFWSGPSSSLCKLKVIHLKGTYIRLSISQDCCPNLETLQLEQNDGLMELQLGTLQKWFKMVNEPKSVELVKVYERRSKKRKVCFNAQ